jgi:alpha-L-fucosidase
MNRIPLPKSRLALVWLLLAVVGCGGGPSRSGAPPEVSGNGGHLGTTGGDSGAGSSSSAGGNAGAVGIGGSLAGGGASSAGTGGQLSTGGAAEAGGAAPSSNLEALQRAFVDLRFGMFLHFGILTYTGKWSEANLPIEQFNPTQLNAEQWADAAVSAHMKFGVLTTRHHDGFALWPSAASTFNVGHISWMGGKGDVVRAYVDAFRSRGLLPGLYYSIWDNTQGIGNGTVTPAQLSYVKAQLTELLSNYGPIPILVIDGWAWKTGHQTVAYQEIRDLVKSLQPDCLLTDHTHLGDPWDVDIVNFEEPAMVFAPTNNRYPAQQEQKLNSTGGNDWFWAPNIGGLMSVSTVVAGHLAKLEPVWTNFLLNCPPNRDGLLDPAMVTLLAQVGAAWSPSSARPPLPSQGPQNEAPYTPVSASATSGTARNAIDGVNDTSKNTLWQSTGALPQSITLDLGQSRPDVGYLGYVPRYANNVGSTTGNIEAFAVLVSTDGTTFSEAASGTWPADGKMKAVSFGPVGARYVRLEARSANGASAVATEVTVGARR